MTQLGSYAIAVATLGLALAWLTPVTSANAQETADRWLVGVMLSPLSLRYSTTESVGGLSSTTKQTTHRMHVGIERGASLVLGAGIDAFVFGLELGVFHETTEVDLARDEGEYDFFEEDEVTYTVAQTEIAIGPQLRYLFLEGCLRPLVQLGAGVVFVWEDSPPTEMTQWRLQPAAGVQIGVADSASIDTILRLSYSTGSGTSTVPSDTGLNTTTGQFVQNYAEREHQAESLEVALGVGVSWWL